MEACYSYGLVGTCASFYVFRQPSRIGLPWGSVFGTTSILSACSDSSALYFCIWLLFVVSGRPFSVLWLLGLEPYLIVAVGCGDSVVIVFVVPWFSDCGGLVWASAAWYESLKIVWSSFWLITLSSSLFLSLCEIDIGLWRALSCIDRVLINPFVLLERPLLFEMEFVGVCVSSLLDGRLQLRLLRKVFVSGDEGAGTERSSSSDWHVGSEDRSLGSESFVSTTVLIFLTGNNGAGQRSPRRRMGGVNCRLFLLVAEIRGASNRGGDALRRTGDSECALLVVVVLIWTVELLLLFRGGFELLLL